ncbi:ComF family protein [Jannaschia sp. W003]|uniref:ComF family protein n=1 Tax=Jannaschia sp. W003 TaxID=2867012 RepID=UPI0021A4EF08|nr:ComF family protein [Jannaschia sp. W003]UWQ21959.1 ComF family protein [Jannaschia sp. W003]
MQSAALGPALRAAGAALRDAVYPLTCLLCEARVEAPGLCPACWRDTPFVGAACCPLCAMALPGTEGAALCDECLTAGRPWDEARAALRYEGRARSLVLQLKHGDRTELADAAALWLHARARDLLGPDTLLVPVPLHRWRLARRRYNQAALIACALARRSGAGFDPLALRRTRRTPSQDRRSRAERFANLAGAIEAVRPLAGHVALVDDVMTSGATLAACADAVRAAGARRVSVLVLARVAPH